MIQAHGTTRSGTIDALFAGFNQCGSPGAAVGVSCHGRPVYRKGFGLSSMELPVALSPSTRMRIGATSNQFAALACLLMCEDGKCDLDDPLGKHLPELHAVSQRVTLRQIMGHVSGLRDAFEVCFQLNGMGGHVSSEELLSLYHSLDDVNAEPGVTWSFNHGGYLLLSAVLERIADQPLEDILRERIFDPLGMYDTALRRRDADFMPCSATPHSLAASGAFEKSYLGTALAGEGGVVSTVDDMLRWLAHMDEPRIGSQKTWAAMRTPQILRNGASSHYGLGLMIDRYRGLEIVWHVAGAWGGSAQAIKAPAGELDIIVMVNRADGWAGDFAERILDACIPDLEPVAQASTAPIAIGIFRSPRTGRVIELFGAHERQIIAVDGLEMAYQPDTNGVWHVGGAGKYLKRKAVFEGDVQRPHRVRLVEFGNLDEFIALNPADHDDVDAIAGHYRSDATGTDAIVSRTVDGANLETRGRFGTVTFDLQCLSEGIWRARSVSEGFLGGILSFDDDVFFFSAERLSALPFRRCA